MILFLCNIIPIFLYTSWPCIRKHSTTEKKPNRLSFRCTDERRRRKNNRNKSGTQIEEKEYEKNCQNKCSTFKRAEIKFVGYALFCTHKYLLFFVVEYQFMWVPLLYFKYVFLGAFRISVEMRVCICFDKLVNNNKIGILTIELWQKGHYK